MPHKIPYCARPWASLMLYPDRAGPECALSDRINCPIEGKTWEDIWNSEQMKYIRTTVLNDQEETLGCKTCEYYGSESVFYEELTVLINNLEAQRNFCLNKEEFFAGNILLTSKPIAVSADISYKCNFKCLMCELILDAKEMDSSNLNNLFQILTKSTVHLHISGGEPLMHKGFVHYLEFPNATPSILSITTNGSLLKRNILENLKFFSGVNLHISIDSFSQDVFSRMRPGSNPHDILNNLNHAVRMKNELKNTDNCKSWYICLQFLPCILNINEFPSYISKSSNLGIDEIQVCEISGNYPQYDFIKNPALLRDTNIKLLVKEIKSAIAKYPKLEFTGVENLISKLESSIV